MTVDLKSNEVFPVGWGLIYCVWCAPKSFTAEEVQTKVNAKDRPGTSLNEWVISEPKERDDSFNGVNSNPCPDDADRTHWLLNC